MEKELERQLDETMSQSGVVGLVCADSKGLCLGARGNGTAYAAAHITTLANKGRELAPYGSDPVIILESPGCNVLIKQQGGITLAVNKIP
ncbi:ragulator complex protein LAMTOR5 homolog [Corticium candelabrum]|uniref:ragulator complex protein LAMTOR5 homolog n=1 Tax=Corticium candelabrum TaxID=121492 RepID=UPI002E26949A|nr:ragulator complex protein LAMTOR5 homolog [Corticium candelabrum]